MEGISFLLTNMPKKSAKLEAWPWVEAPYLNVHLNASLLSVLLTARSCGETDYFSVRLFLYRYEWVLFLWV